MSDICLSSCYSAGDTEIHGEETEMDTEDRIFVQYLEPGDRVDLEGDRFADPEHDDPAFEFEYQVVELVEVETAAVVVTFETAGKFSFPHGHAVNIVTR